MLLTTRRTAATAHIDFRADELANLAKWAFKNELEAYIEPADGAHPNGMIFVGYGEGMVHWTIYRAEGNLWLCRIEDRTEQGREGSKMAVESVEDALAKIMVDTEA